MTSLDERAPLHFLCPGCGADSDAEDKVFEFGNPAFVPDADYVLIDVRCGTCGTRTDFAVWLVDKKDFLREPGASGELSDAISPDAVAMLDRYHSLVEEYHRQWEDFYRSEPELHEMDLSTVSIEIPTETRITSIPSVALAAARGLRKAALAHPGMPPVGLLQIGHFGCLVSFDEPTAEARPHILHLSVKNALTPGWLSAAEQRFVLSLCFAPGEWPSIVGEGGQIAPVIHYYLEAGSLQSGKG